MSVILVDDWNIIEDVENEYSYLNEDNNNKISIMTNRIEINSKGYFSSISQFKLLEDIGIGSFGKVKLALHRGTCKYYAIKIIDLTATLTNKQINLLTRQITVHSKLDHPHVIKLWDTISDGNNIYMIMEYAQKGSLFSYHSKLLLDGQQSQMKQIYKFFYQTLQAVKYLHSIDIMHRDIKPENLLLDQNFNIKLCDFGWATNQIDNPRTTFCGTYEYMAPQMVLQKSYDYRIDIWALGVLLFELVHGKAPFRAEDLSIMKQKISIGSYQINSECSENLKDLIVDILQFIPQKRLSLFQIQNQKWVKQCQKQCIKQECRPKQISGTLKGRINSDKKIHPKQQKEDKVIDRPKYHKHQHQRSMGELYIEEETENHILNEDQQNWGYQNIQILDYSGFKKHRRNVTQPIMQSCEQPQKKQDKRKHSSRKFELTIGNLRTEANTPNQILEKVQEMMHGNKILNTSIKKQKHKAYVEQYPTITVDSKKINFESDQHQHSIRKKVHMRTQTGPIIGGAGQMRGHSRNLSSNQLKDVNMKQKIKIKKKLKIPEKNSEKVKKIEEKLYEISKYGTEKVKPNKVYFG